MKRIDDQELKDDIASIYKQLGRPPSKTEYNKYGKFSEPVWILRYGSWNNALKSICGKTFQSTQLPQKLECEYCYKEVYKLPCNIRQNKHHFCSLSCSSKYMQKNKSSGTNKSKVELYIKQGVISKYPKLKMSFNNRSLLGKELDIYIDGLRLAFEINGIFHYKPIFGLEKLQKTQQNDRYKCKQCNKLGITLVVIDVTFMNVFKEDKSKKFLDQVIAQIEEKLSEPSVSIRLARRKD